LKLREVESAGRRRIFWCGGKGDGRRKEGVSVVYSTVRRLGCTSDDVEISSVRRPAVARCDVCEVWL
jgi:hypothetical protein